MGGRQGEVTAAHCSERETVPDRMCKRDGTRGLMRILMTVVVIGCLTLIALPGDVRAGADRLPAASMEPSMLDQIKVLDLETAQRIALANSPTLTAAAERVNQASERILQAQAAYWPTLDANGSASRVDLSDNAVQSQQSQLQLLVPNASVNNPEDYYRASLMASWTVFDGFQRHFNNALARYGQDASQAALSESKRLLLSSVADSYYLAQLARENIAITDADEAFNQRQLEEAQTRYRVGTGALSDILNFEVQVNAARSQRNGFNREYQIALVGLAALMGVPDASLPPALDLARLPTESEQDLIPPEPAGHLDYALQHRPDVLQTESRLQQSQATVGIARSRFYPSLQLAGSVDGERASSARFQEDDFGNTVGLYLTYRIYSGGQRRALLAETKYQEKEVEENLRAVKISVSKDVQEAVANVVTAQRELELQRKNAKLVNENRDLVEKEYQAGQASLVRLNEAQRNLTQAQARLALARVGLRQAFKNLNASTGRILLPFGAP
jgi:outer membrane protein